MSKGSENRNMILSVIFFVVDFFKFIEQQEAVQRTFNHIP